MALHAAVLAAAGLTAAFAPPQSVPLLAVALALLGFGWSLGLVAGTTAITNNTPVATRARTQGTVDVFIALAGAGGGLVALVQARRQHRRAERDDGEDAKNNKCFR
mgnify:CR=1 FL=1